MVVADRSPRTLVVVTDLLEVDSLSSLAACLTVNQWVFVSGVEWIERTGSPAVGVGHNLVEEEVRSLEVGGDRSLEAGIVAVVDSHVAAPGRGRRTWRCGIGWDRMG